LTPHKKPGVAFWATVVVAALPIAYAGSFGPACWLANRGILNHLRVADAYDPFVRFSGYDATSKAAAALRWYGSCLAIDGSDGTLNTMELYLVLSEESEVSRAALGYDKQRWADVKSSPLFPARK